MKFLVFFTLALFFAKAAHANSHFTFANKKTQYKSHSFYITSSSEVSKNNKSFKPFSFIQQMPNCKSKIKTLMCLVDPVLDNQGSSERECLSGGEQYAVDFENLYDNLPVSLQKVFCSLNVIYIEKDLATTAYAGASLDSDGNKDGAFMGVNKSILDHDLNLKQLASWKEQLSFGGIQQDYQITPSLPIIKTSSNTSINDMLFFITTHEFGHILDFSNNLNNFTSCEFKDNNYFCNEPKSDSWTELSWITNKTPLSKDEFKFRNKLCFYWCNGDHIQGSEISSLYNSIYYNSSFLSIYASISPWEDFADSFAYFLLEKHLNSSYIITYDNVELNIIDKLHSEQFAPKYNFIDDFLTRAKIIYP